MVSALRDLDALLSGVELDGWWSGKVGSKCCGIDSARGIDPPGIVETPGRLTMG